MTSKPKPTLGEPEFYSTSALKTYVRNGRGLLRPLYHELQVAGEELYAVLRYVPTAEGNTSMVRAKLVSMHLKRAAGAVEVATTEMVRTYASFLKHYTTELEASRARSGRRAFHFDQ